MNRYQYVTGKVVKSYIDLPSYVSPNNMKVWFKGHKFKEDVHGKILDEWGILHRENGPAIEDKNGYKAWYKNGKLHREDGPAVIWPGGEKEWCLNGSQMTEKQFNKKIKEL